MTTPQLFHLALGIIQLCFGAYVACYGFHLTRRKWDRTQGEYLAGMILAVLGLIIIFMLGIR